jgi:predicted SAM-dependent methyltransferase
VTDTRTTLTQYLDQIRAEDRANIPAWKKSVRTMVPDNLRMSVRVAMTDVFTFAERPRARRLAAHSPVRLHLGSGHSRKEGWINVDLKTLPVDLAWNLVRPLPLKPRTVDAIFHEHLLEHLSLAQGISLTRECFRLLKPGGVLRLGVPDAGRYLHSYCDEGRSAFLESNRPGRPTRMLAIQEIFYRHGHRCMYDFETLQAVCAAAGFGVLEERSFGESRLIPCPDSAKRRAETLYVEAIKEDG